MAEESCRSKPVLGPTSAVKSSTPETHGPDGDGGRLRDGRGQDFLLAVERLGPSVACPRTSVRLSVIDCLHGGRAERRAWVSEQGPRGGAGVDECPRRVRVV